LVIFTSKQLSRLTRRAHENAAMTLPVPVTNGYANYEWLFILDTREGSERVPGSDNRAAFTSVTGSEKVRSLEIDALSLITPALHRQSAFIAIKAAEAASLIGKSRVFDQKDYCHVQFAVHCCLTQLRFIDPGFRWLPFVGL
jgi:hypothetical protein